MKSVLRAFGLFGILLVCSGASYDVEFARGMQYHKLGKYAQAETCFQSSVSGVGANSAPAHYYLADSLLRLGQVTVASQEYEAVVRLDPTGQYGAYAQQALRALKRSSPAHSDAVSLDINSLKGSLPDIPKDQDEKPAYSDIVGWSLQERSNYSGEASERINRATEKLDGAKKLKERADFALRTGLRQPKKYGESELDFEKRMAEADKAMKSYEDYLTHCEQQLEQQQNILNTCRSAKLELSGYYR